ncbi:hypothetical protein IT568_04885 [bacterium]|nr:hypothetical protein [bacterium]
MTKIKVGSIAHSRSGDKGAGSNVGVIAYDKKSYEILDKTLTPEAVKKHFSKICFGSVEKYCVPNLLALNFILNDSLGGGGSASLKTDAQGKTHGQAILLMEIEIEIDE